MKRWICLLLTLTLMLGSFALPAQAESNALNALLQTLRKTTPTPEAPAEETPPPAEETDAPAEEQEEADSEADAEDGTDQAADSVFESGYVTVPAGTKAYRTAALSALAGVFTAEGNAYAMAASGTALELAFVNAGTRQTTVVYVGRDAVIPLSASEAGSLKVTLALKGAPKYEGFPLPAAAFGVPMQEPTAEEAPEQEPASEEEPVPETADEDELVPEVTDIGDKADAAWKAAPTNVTAVLSADGTKAAITWTGNSACTGYAVYEQLASGYKVLGTVTGADKTTYTTKALEDGEHTFYVKAKNGSQVGYASETVSVTIGGATSTPAPTATPGPNAWKTAPTNVTAEVSADGTKAVLSWTGNDACTGYAIYEQLASGYKVMGTVTGADKTTYTTKALEDGEHVFYVKPRNGSQVGYASETVSVTVGGETPTPAPTATPNPNDWRTAPTNLAAELSADGTKAVISWTGNDVCTGYAIYEQLESGYKVLGNVTGADKTSFTTKALEDGEHTFYVKAKKNSAVGYASETVSVTVGGATPTPAPTATPDPDAWKTAPANVSAVLSADYTKAVLTWDANPACTGYAIYEQLADGSYKVMGTVSSADTLTYTTKALAEGSHTLYVKTRNGSKVGTASETVTVTIPAAWKIPPENVSAVLSADYTKAVLTWDANPACTGYAIYEQLADGSYKVLGSVSGADRTTYTTKTLESGQHTLYVKSKNGSQVGYASETVSVTIPSADELWRMAPTDVTAVLSDDPTKAVLSWTGNAYCTGYAVYEQLDSGYKVLGTVTGADTTTFTTKALTPGEHTFYVKPRRNSAVGSASDTVSVTVPNIFSGTWGSLSWILNADGLLTISGTGAMNALDPWSGDAWRAYTNEIRNVVMTDGVTSIGNYAFSSCDNLTNVTIPDSVTSIGDYAFASCDNLTSVTIPGSVTSIGYEAFSSCESLTSVTIPASVTNIGEWAFALCTGLTGVTIPDSITSIGGYVFAWSGLTSVTIPDSVTSIGEYAFTWCENLTSVTIPGSVTSIGFHAFACSGLSSVTIPAGVTDIGEGAFLACTALSAINVSAGNGVYASANGVLFNKAMTTLIAYPAGKQGAAYTIPASVTGIGQGAFNSCTSLTSMTIPDNVTSIGNGAFAECTSLTSVTIPHSVTAIGNNVFAHCASLTSVTIPDSVTSIGSHVFAYSGLTSVTIPDSVTSIGDGAFTTCRSLTSVTIPAGVTSIDRFAFYSCESMTSVMIPVSVTSIGMSAFDYCLSLATVYYGGTQEEWNSIAIEGMNSSLESAEIVFTPLPSGTWGNLSWILDADGLLTISGSGQMEALSPWNGDGDAWLAYRNDIREAVIGSGVTSIGDFAFFECMNMTNVTIPYGTESIAMYAFASCANLESITIPDSVTEIGNDAFGWCTKLTEVTIPRSVTNLGECICFANSALTAIHVATGNTNYVSVDGVLFNSARTELLEYPAGKTDSSYVIPGTVTSIGPYAFSWTRKLTAVTIPASVTIIGAKAFCGGDRLAEINVSSGNNDYASVDGVLLNKDCTALISYPAGRAGAAYAIPDGVIMVGLEAFNSCVNLTDVTLPDGVTEISEMAFYGCTNLTSITIPNSVGYIRSMAFEDCTALNTVRYTGTQAEWDGITIEANNENLLNAEIVFVTPLPSGTWGNLSWTLDADGLLTISGSGQMNDLNHWGESEDAWLAYKTDIREAVIGAGITSIGACAFYGCTNLTNVAIPSSVTSVGHHTFNDCNSLTSVTLSQGIADIGAYAFAYCPKLENVFLAPGVVSQTFSQWYGSNLGLITLSLPSSVTSVGDGVFAHTALNSITPDLTVTDNAVPVNAYRASDAVMVRLTSQVASVGSNAFANCASLRYVVIDSSSVTLDEDAFLGCSGLVFLLGRVQNFIDSPVLKYIQDHGYEFRFIEYSENN